MLELISGQRSSLTGLLLPLGDRTLERQEILLMPDLIVRGSVTGPARR